MKKTKKLENRLDARVESVAPLFLDSCFRQAA
jgi:hypothetical protein